MQATADATMKHLRPCKLLSAALALGLLAGAQTLHADEPADTIKSLIELNLETYDELKDRFPQLRLLDTTYLDQKSAVQAAASLVLDMLEKKIQKLPKLTVL